MPIYEYECTDCGARFERIRPRDEAHAAPPCPQCDRQETRLCLSAFSSFSRTDGQTRSLAGGSNCASCSASSCAGCKG
ncbi:MAG: zinc ribbon domain-containing protein [Chloroflexia bacterium]|nr:zinc ribbon domain-containing protein [Chloroflexia bacterium]